MGNESPESVPLTQTQSQLSKLDSQDAGNDNNKTSPSDRAAVYVKQSAIDGQEAVSLRGADNVPDADDGAIRLQPKMTLQNGITVIVGSIIGSGIFVAPKGVLKDTGSVGLSLIVWVLSGVYSLIGAYCFAELGCMIPKSGADYAYIMTSFGPFLAFMRLWIECIVVRPTSQAIVALTFANYALRPFFTTCDPPMIATQSLAILCILVLTFVNCWSVKWSTRVQDVCTYGKLLALGLIIASGVYQLTQGKTQNFSMDGSIWNVSQFALSFYSGLFAYNGWNYLNFIIEELKEPEKNLPKAIFISVILVTVVYTLTIMSFHTTMSVADVLASEAVASTFAKGIYGNLALVVPAFVALSTFGGVNGILLTSSRLFYAGAEERQMPSVLSMIQINHLTPTPAVIAMCLLSLLYLFFKDIYLLINYVGFTSWLAIGLAVACVPYLRWKHPEWRRPIKVHMFWPILYIIATIFIVVVPALSDPYATGMGCAIILTGMPVYFVFIGMKNKPAWLNNIVMSTTHTLQKIMVVVPPEKKAT